MNLNYGILANVYGESCPLYVYILLVLAVSVISYLLGSVNSAIIISRAMYNEDIRTKGSGNPGLTNMLRTYGGKAAALTLAGDMLKTLIPVFIAGLVFGFGYAAGTSTVGECYMAGFFAVIGHVFPVYYKFKGGKGVLCTATLALVLSPIPFAILLILFVIIVSISKYVSLGSVTVAVLYPVVLNGLFSFVFERPSPVGAAIASIFLAIIVVWCHRENLERISQRTERKLSFGGKKKDKDE